MRVMTLGTFDMLHYGHMKLLKRCKELAGNDAVIVGLNTDKFVEYFKNKPPVMTYEERQKALLILPWVDQVVRNYQPLGSAGGLIEREGIKMIVIGSDWGKKDYLKQLGIDWEWLETRGIYLCYVPYTYKISSTILKERLSSL